MGKGGIGRVNELTALVMLVGDGGGGGEGRGESVLEIHAWPS